MSPKSSRAELKVLRDEALERDGECRWPGCYYELNGINPLQMAHLDHRGMGGRTDVNRIESVIMLCRLHHDIFDGRTGPTKLRGEIRTMLKAQI